MLTSGNCAVILFFTAEGLIYHIPDFPLAFVAEKPKNGKNHDDRRENFSYGAADYKLDDAGNQREYQYDQKYHKHYLHYPHVIVFCHVQITQLIILIGVQNLFKSFICEHL